jgi:ribosomal protein S18 acetylase RimI-like enzyme
MLYRPYQSADFAQLYAIEQACFQPPFRFPRRYMQHLVTSTDSATWVAEEDGQLAGFAIVEWTVEDDQAIAYIQTIEVSPAHRKEGVGAELLRKVESSAVAAHARAVWLHVAESNAPAIHLYETHGYLRQGREEDYYAQSIPALIYAKPLE